MATEFIPAAGVSMEELALDAQLSSLSDETPEGRSIVVFAKRFVPKLTGISEKGMIFVPSTAQTRLSGVDIGPVTIRKGAVEAVVKLVDVMPSTLTQAVERIAKAGGTPLAVARDGKARGVIYLKDVVKGHTPALRAAARHGHPHRDDHRGQP